VTFLLDTNVVSEWVKPQPDPGVVRWLADADEDRLYLTVVTLAELRHGIERLDVGARRKRIEAWIDELKERFEQRILPIDENVAEYWGRLMARSEAKGRRIHVMGGFLAATAEVHGLTLVTRNVEDFATAGCPLYSPWADTD
jgi:toxin FitB